MDATDRQNPHGLWEARLPGGRGEERMAGHRKGGCRRPAPPAAPTLDEPAPAVRHSAAGLGQRGGSGPDTCRTRGGRLSACVCVPTGLPDADSQATVL